MGSPVVDLADEPADRGVQLGQGQLCLALLGALARYGLGMAFPRPPGGFPWTTFAINVTGCLLIGVLMVAITEIWDVPAWVRPLLGVGVLGGFTTFSTYIVDTGQLLTAGAPREALLYLVATPVMALAAVWAGSTATRSLARRAAGRRRV
ncbi:fluoride efflux transporter CrcB [Nonomuraea guangzhouensis]|uniref:Fluoride-specific ion channel FluC n=1 Tax=Nonomuraea guangzhouensis TaxID=1291555 RepID=A0ABW4GGF9_9ACTN|nr:fluoride efflux transporter CrcB [Nonomuraea guangzhouensis]